MSGINKLVTLELDKERHLRLTLRGIMEFEHKTGKSLLKGFSRKDLSLEDCAALIWVCLIHEDRELSYDSVLDMVDVDNIAQVMDSVMECTGRAFPKVNKPPLHKKPQVG